MEKTKAENENLPYEEEPKLAVGVSPIKRIGTALVEAGHITDDQLRIALHEQKKADKEMLGEALLRLGFIGQNNLSHVLAERAGTKSIDLKTTNLDAALLTKVPTSVATEHMIIPIRHEKNTLHVAMADPYNIVAIDAVRRYFTKQTEIIPFVTNKANLDAIIATLKTNYDTMDQILRDLDGYEDHDYSESSSYEHPIVRLVNHIMDEAISKGASDIHLEPEDKFVRIRFRIDGTLRQIHALHITHWPALSHRIKIMASMNIADTRSIQDGRFSKESAGSMVDFRVAVMPSVSGETISVRLLDHKKSLIPLEKLGYSDTARAKLELISEKPQGITLVTGPTGSGKTTTLYSILQKLSSPDVHIATLEEPVEFQLDLIRQTAIQEATGVDFASGVRGLLRMDPDIILIGEIRDAETAQMALRAAMTGHQVYTTLHTNDALGAVPRLIDLGLNPRVLAGNISGIIAQRLVRKLCPYCRYSYEATAEERKLLAHQDGQPLRLADANGCPHCEGTGRLGRTVIAEVITPSPEMDELIAKDEMPLTLKQQALRDGYTTLKEDGILKVTSHEIALRDLKQTVDMTRPR